MIRSMQILCINITMPNKGRGHPMGGPFAELDAVRTVFLALRKDKVKWLDVVQAVRINQDLVVDAIRPV